MSEYDSPWKEALDLYFEMFLLFFFPKIHADIDWSRGYEFLDKELQKIAPKAAVGRRVVDKLVRVWRKSGQEEWILIHIEVQSQRVADFALIIYQYNYRIFDRYNQKVVSLAILGDDQKNWRPNSYGYDLWGFSLDVSIPVVKLLDYADSLEELEQFKNPFAVIVLAHLKSMETRSDPQQRRAWKFRLVRMLYERGMNADDVRQLFKFIDWMMDLPRDLELEFLNELDKYEEGYHMPYVTSVERFAMERTFLKGIEKCLKIKFGAAGMDLMPEIREIQDHLVLEAVLDAIETVASPQDLRELWKEKG